jgi:hypothetical protein
MNGRRRRHPAASGDGDVLAASAGSGRRRRMRRVVARSTFSIGGVAGVTRQYLAARMRICGGTHLSVITAGVFTLATAYLALVPP